MAGSESGRSEMNGFSPINMPVRMPSPRSKFAPKFDGRNLSEFMVEFELSAKAALLSDEEKARIILNYVTKKVKRTLEDLKEFRKADWKVIVIRLKRLYASADQQYQPSLTSLRSFVKKRRKITKRAHLDKYTADFMRKSNKLIEISRLTTMERDRSYYMGLPEQLREKIRARIQSRGKTEECPNGYTKINPPPMDVVIDEAEKEYENDAFDAPSESEDEDSGSEFYSEDETASDVESSDDERKQGKREVVRTKEEVKTQANAGTKTMVSKENKTVTKKQVISPINELTQMVKDLRLEMANVKSDRNIEKSNETRTFRCFMCDGTVDHMGGFRRCPETVKLLSESLIKYADNGRLVLMNGEDLPRVLPGGGGVANVIRDLKGKLRPEKGSRAMCADLYLDGEPALSGDSFAISCEKFENRAAERTKKVIRAAKDEIDGKVMRSGKRLKFSHTELPKKTKLTKLEERSTENPEVIPEEITTERPADRPANDAQIRGKERSEAADREIDDDLRFEGRVPPEDNMRDAYKERTKGNKALRKDVIMKENSEAKPGNRGAYRYTSDLREETSVAKVAQKVLETDVILPLKMILAGSSDLQKEIFGKARMRREFVGALAIADTSDETDGSDREAYHVDRGVHMDVRQLVEKCVYSIAATQPKFYAVGTARVEGKLGGEKATFLVDSGSELNLMPLRVQQCLHLPVDPDGSRWHLKGIADQNVPLVGCCRDVCLEIGGHRFNHHIFVSAEDCKYDAILGQPWLTWVSAMICYSGRDGSMSITAFVDGDSKGPRVVIPALRTGPRNQANLVFASEYEAEVKAVEYSYQKAGTNATPALFSGKLVENVPTIGSRLEYLCGATERKYMRRERAHILALGDGISEGYDKLLRTVDQTVYRPPNGPRKMRNCEWVDRALGSSRESGNKGYDSMKAKYKPVKDRVYPVQAPLPDPRVDVYKEIVIPEQEPLPIIPPRYGEYAFDGRLNEDRINLLLGQVAGNFLTKEEILLLVFVLVRNQEAIAFTDEERGTFSSEYYPDYVIPTIPHLPWCDRVFRLPKIEQETIMRLITQQQKSGKYEPSTGPYRSSVFTVKKKDGSARLVHDMRSLNAVTIRDAALPPRVEDFAEGFVGRHIYMVADLFSGYDARVLAVESRDLTAFHTPKGSAMRLTSIPQGYTNAMQVFQRSTFHALGPEVPENADVFVDDCGIKGPSSNYNNEPVPGNLQIRKFVYEFLTTVNRILVRFRCAGITVSGWKLVAATPVIKIVGSVCSANGWHLEKGLITKILNWPECKNASEVRGFLGTAGVGRKWIKSFSLIAKPLTKLTKNVEFEWGLEEVEAMDRIKQLVTKAPVLKVLNYETAKREFADLKEINEDGLVIVAVDSSIYGAGWVLYQIYEDGRHPILFGSCTFSDTESKYSQPKVELYGCFRAISALKHRIWGLRFRLEMDAKFVKEMLEKPDLPNAPMTRWVSYLKLFDFEIKHVPATRHRIADGLSRRRRDDADSDDNEPEIELQRYVGVVDESCGWNVDKWTYVWNECFKKEWEIANLPLVNEALINDQMSKRIAEQWMSALCPRSRAAVIYPDFGNYDPLKPTKNYYRHEHEKFGCEEPLRDVSCDLRDVVEVEAYLRDTLLRSTDFQGYMGMEFYIRKERRDREVEVLLGDELIVLEMVEYRHKYRAKKCFLVTKKDLIGDVPMNGLTPKSYEGWRKPNKYIEMGNKECDGKLAPSSSCYMTRGNVETAEVWDGVLYWDAVKKYLVGEGLTGVFENTKDNIRKKFKVRAERYLIREERLYRKNGDNLPQLVIETFDKRNEYLRNSHDMTGHRGINPTFKRLWDVVWWPGMWRDVEWYVQSCYSCQIRSKYRPIAPLNPRASIAVFRKVFLDTKVMPKSSKGYRYILHAQEDLASWPEARAVRQNTSEAWASFVYEEILCRFGHQMVFVCDNGAEFKGMALKIFLKYKIPCILASPYHPQANAVVERSHQTMTNSLLKICNGNERRWPEYLHATLLAMRVTANRHTGLTPYFLVYGQNPVFPWDIDDPTWQKLEWDRVGNREDLIALRALQIARKEEDVGDASVQSLTSRERGARDFMRRYKKSLSTQEFGEGMWVLKHETWLDNQMGNKDRSMWSGPYVITRRTLSGSYYLAELDGTLIKEPVAAMRLKPFWYRGTVLSDKGRRRGAMPKAITNINLDRRPIQDSFEINQTENTYLTLKDLAEADRVLLIDTISSKFEVPVETNIKDLLGMRDSVKPWW